MHNILIHLNELTAQPIM